MDLKSETDKSMSLKDSPKNTNGHDRAGGGLIIDMAKALDRCTHQCVYIIDYIDLRFIYVSRNIARLCGCEAEDIKNLGSHFYEGFMPQEDWDMLIEINRSALSFLNKRHIADRKKYTVSFDLHLTNGKKQRLFHHKLTPLTLSKDGRIHLAICFMAFSATNTPGNVIMKKHGAKVFYEYSFTAHKWLEKKEVILSDIEHEILSLSAQGYTMDGIADIICKSVDSVKAYKSSIFKKMSVKNIAAALTFAQNHQLL
jgi:DNA-binding CsgD family transcriptional regulator